jgi:hypothetical protein
VRARVVGCLALFAGGAAAQGLPPWLEPVTATVDEGARSVVVQNRDEPIYVAPDTHAAKRGAGAKGARLPLFGSRSGPGCPAGFFLIGANAWICASGAAPSKEPPLAVTTAETDEPDGLPLPYFFVGADGAFGYADLATAEDTKPSREFEQGFAVAISQTAKRDGDPFGLTTKGLWLPLRDLRRAVPLSFRGYDAASGKLDQGWVVVDRATVYSEPGGRHLAGRAVDRFERVVVLEERKKNGRSYVRVGEGRWLDASSVRVPSLAPPPAELGPGERFIDVDLQSQVLTAYEGTKPVFATLVSTGIGHGSDVTVTPAGVHRIWVKLRTTDMTNLEDEEALRYYAIEDVPWVMFFEKGYGLHGAFWHRSFGHVRSHGCVNLTPLDAKRLFDWAGPRLPAGWTAVLPTEYDPGTLVRVR